MAASFQPSVQVEASRGRDLASLLGPASAQARALVPALCQHIERQRISAVSSAYLRWERACGRLYGVKLARAEKAEGSLFSDYGIPGQGSRLRPFLFAIQTYFILVRKLVAADFVSTCGSAAPTEGTPPSFAASLSGGGLDRIFRLLCRLEDGKVFEEAGILGWHECGQYFGWYLEVFDQFLAVWIASLARVVAESQVRQSDVTGTGSTEVLKDLYRALVPKRLRTALGEFSTPDWLASLVLNEVGYLGDPSDRLLDPACGSGTFLVQALSRVGGGWTGPEAKAERLTEALPSLAAFDLNPAVAARVALLVDRGRLTRSPGSGGDRKMGRRVAQTDWRNSCLRGR